MERKLFIDAYCTYGLSIKRFQEWGKKLRNALFPSVGGVGFGIDQPIVDCNSDSCTATDRRQELLGRDCRPKHCSLSRV